MDNMVECQSKATDEAWKRGIEQEEERHKQLAENDLIIESVETEDVLNEGDAPEDIKEITIYNDGFIGYFERYQELLTNAPRQFGTHFIIQLMGHAMGRNTINEIQPLAVHHNTQLCLIGNSGTSRKTTTQEIAKKVDMSDTFLPNDFSPEGLLAEMAERPHGKIYLGEFSTLLRGIRGNSYKAGFKEITNELFTCPEIYHKRLSKSKNSFTIYEPYLCINTTVTPEQFFGNIDEEMVHGGFIPRYMLVEGNAKYRKRGLVPDEARIMESYIRRIIRKIYDLFYNQKIIFKLNEDALERFNEIDRDLQENIEWRGVQPFVARYTEYLISYADVFLLSDLLGTIGRENIENILNLQDFNNLTLKEFNKISIQNIQDRLPSVGLGVNISCDTQKSVKLLNCCKTDVKNFPNGDTEERFILEVNRDYIDRAWETIKPSLRLAKAVEKYIQEDRHVAKLESIIDKYRPITRSRAMQYSHLKKRQFDEALETLKDRRTHFELQIVGKNNMPLSVYCIKGCINSARCKRCKFNGSCRKETRDPQINGGVI